MISRDIALIAHLMRRAGFGATRDELDTYASKGYEATVEELLNFDDARSMPEDLIRRWLHEAQERCSYFHSLSSFSARRSRMLTTGLFTRPPRRGR